MHQETELLLVKQVNGQHCHNNRKLSGTRIFYSEGNIGIGVSNVISSKLTINNIVNDRWTYDHSTSPLIVTNQTGTGSLGQQQMIHSQY